MKISETMFLNMLLFSRKYFPYVSSEKALFLLYFSYFLSMLYFTKTRHKSLNLRKIDLIQASATLIEIRHRTYSHK